MGQNQKAQIVAVTLATASEISVDATLMAVLSDLGGTDDFLSIQHFIFKTNWFLARIQLKKSGASAVMCS